MCADPDDSSVDIFNDALELDESRREAFLAKVGAGNPALVAEVQSLLTAHNQIREESFLEPPAAERSIGGILERDTATSIVDQRIGAYHIREVLGEGSMGVVYLADQEHPHRTVALKIIKPCLISKKTLRRFEHEVEALGRLQHPGIAQIFEAGSAQSDDPTVSGQPFFAMEYVRGEPVTQYAKDHRLDGRDRLELMARICDAVHEAHQKGVIHRDLKPSNVLVDASGQPKILDFGVARATNSDVSATTLCTEIGQIVGTLLYMSPEQCLADPSLLDTRSDIYALGVMLHELLTGSPPYDLKLRSIPEAMRIITEHDPTRLGSIDKSLRGDVETIVAKVLEKDKARRYQSAAELASDIRRHLGDEPILARPTSSFYQIRKFAKRNRAFVSAATVAMVVLITGVAWASAHRARLEAERQHAADAMETANQYRGLSLLTIAEMPGAISDRRLGYIHSWLNEQTDLRPHVEERARELIGLGHHAHGHYKQAAIELQRVLEISRAQYGATDQITLRSVNVLFNVYRDAGMLEDAESLLRKALDASRYAPGMEQQHLDTPKGCIKALRLLKLRYNLGEVLHHRGRLGEAETLLRQTLERVENVLAAYRRILPTLFDTRLDEHHFVLEIKTSLGALLVDRGRPQEAEEILREVLTILQQKTDTDDVSTCRLENYLAAALQAEGKRDEAKQLFAKVLRLRRDVLGHDHPETLQTMNHYGRLLMTQGQLRKADPLLRRPVEIAEENMPTHWRTAVYHGDYGEHLMQLKRYPEANEHLSIAFQRLEHSFGRDDFRTQKVLRTLIALHQASGDAH